MKQKKQFGGPCGVLNLTVLVGLSVTMLVGFLGYWKYGDNVKDSVTLNLELKDNMYVSNSINTYLLT